MGNPRRQLKNPAQRAVEEAKRQIQPPGAPDRTSAANSGGGGLQGVLAAPGEITQQDFDDEGNIITKYPMMWDVDGWDDEDTFW